jgi:exoribonuclease-2
MIGEKSLVAYKNHPALVVDRTGEKIAISLAGGEKLKVREKDIEFLHPGPCTQITIDALLPEEESEGIDVKGAWELLTGGSVPLRDLAELVYGEYTAKTAWSAYGLLREGLYFSGSIDAISSRDAAVVASDEERRNLKRREHADREAFLGRLKSAALDLPGDSRFLQDAEALAYGRTDKSRTLRDLGKQETPIEAHRLLLATGVWTPWINPHPFRFGLSLTPARVVPDPPPADEERVDLTHLAAYAIDSPWSHDPDDALSIEGNVLYVHIADPAASILSGTSADLEARGRGATLYLPEGAVRMLADEALALYALGLSAGELSAVPDTFPAAAIADHDSPALTFKLVLGGDGAILDTDIFPSRIRVRRLTYAEVDAAVDAADPGDGVDPVLSELFRVGERNLRRRLAAGAVTIDFPETHIAVVDEKIIIHPIGAYKSADMVRECMLLAGEGAARWALQKRLPFPYVSQETGDLPDAPLPGLAGSYQLRRCMRPRTLSVKPGLHWGLGLDLYTQVTSPLRRYTDLLAHQQIRALLRGRTPLTEDEVLTALAGGEAAATATVQAERASRVHWIAVYLSDTLGRRSGDSQWEGIVMEKRGNRAVIMIPALGLETQAAANGDIAPNDTVTLTLSLAKIPEAEALFVIN